MSKRGKMIGAGLLGLVILFGVLLLINGPKVAAGVKNSVVARINQAINGKVEVGDVGFSVLGKVTVSRISVTDLQNKPVLSCGEVVINYDFSDLIRGNFGLNVVRSVAVSEPKAVLIQDKNDHWNIEDLVKKTTDVKETQAGSKPEDEQLAFRGQVVITNGSVDVTTPEGNRKFDNIAGKISFAEYPKLNIEDTTAALANQKLTAKGHVILADPETQLNLAVGSTAFDPAAVNANLPLKGVAAVNLDVGGTAGKPLIKGSAQIPQGTFADLPFSGATSSFRYSEKVLTIDSLNGNVYGGTIGGTGTVIPGTLRYKMAFSGTRMDTALITEQAVQATADFNADVDGTGNFDNAYAAGNFRLGAGTVSGVSFGSMTGQFRKAGGRLSFSNIVVDVAGRQLKADAVMDGSNVRVKLGTVDTVIDNLKQSLTEKIPGKLPGIKLP